ncbi:MAG: efflux transporter outer membrane subunit [Syntrophobacteraceae bacterium]
MNRFVCFRSSLAVVLASFVFSGCVVGPNYRKPADETPSKWISLSEGASTSDPAEMSRWWTVFKDPALDRLIDQATAANKDLRIAAARVLEARSQRVIAAAGLFPSIDGIDSYSRSKASGNASPSSIPAGSGTFSGGQDLYQAGFDASWELDIFGRVRRTVEAATAEVQASEENYRDTLVTLLSEVSVNYLSLRGAQLRLDIAKKNIQTQRETLHLTKERFEAGLSSELDVAQARAQLAGTEAQVPIFETTIRQSIYQLATLLGQTPEPLVEELSKEAPIPGIPPEVPVGLPSDLLRRRPDIRRAERQLAAATARIGIATADLFPRFNLTGNIGQASMSLADIAKSSSSFWNLGPSMSWSIFNAGSVKANIEVQKARTEQALGLYEKTVLTAIRDVESALVAFSMEQVRRGALVEAVQSNQRAYEISSELYARGLVDFLRVLDSQRSLYQTEEQLALSDQLVSSNLVAVYKALGGGWNL